MQHADADFAAENRHEPAKEIIGPTPTKITIFNQARRPMLDQNLALNANNSNSDNRGQKNDEQYQPVPNRKIVHCFCSRMNWPSTNA
jgi:hypothetical protein